MIQFTDLESISANTNFIANLPDRPNESSSKLKADFDAGADGLKNEINTDYTIINNNFQAINNSIVNTLDDEEEHIPTSHAVYAELQGKIDTDFPDVPVDTKVPSTKLMKTYVLDEIGKAVFETGAGDMIHDVYDGNNDGSVEKADALYTPAHIETVDGEEVTVPLSPTEEGSDSHPVYFENGVPKAVSSDICSMTVADVQDLINNAVNATKQAMFPVGSIITTDNATNPSVSFGFGTWVQFAKGCMLIGVGSNGTKTFASAFTENVSGNKNGTVSIAVGNLPSHSHSVNKHTHTFTGSSATTNSAGSHSHTPNGIGVSFITTGVEPPYASISATGSTYVIKSRTSTDGAHTHTVTAKGTNSATSLTTNTTGSGTAVNIMPPYVACYYWRRTE